ncbi:prepilin-type cleavage/methylation domain-containing protein [Rouxiella sp. WC2420]|uniref:Prepilin-type cleavage/methylation domain-containing protein n=1 Tax=Rouxiella sp. WC2420 TaxID=3234145 RepID=A0AB39VU42_9GAMM
MTLIEIMLVLGLIAMLSIGSLQGWREHQQRARLEQQAQMLRIYLSGLQAQSYQYNLSHLLWTIVGKSGCVGSGIKPADCASAGDSLFKPTAPDITVGVYSEKTMGFYGLRNMAQAGHITLTNAAGTIRVILSARGRIRLCSEGKSIAGMAVC